MPHPFSGKGGRFFSYAEEAEAPLRKGRSAFYYVQLLRAPIALGSRSGAESLRESAEGRSGAIRILGGGYVLMPEHVHLLISEPRKGTPSKVVQVLKHRTSRALRGRKRRGSQAQLSLKFPNQAGELRRFWQKRFYDFNVWSVEKKKEKLNYMHANPVQRKLVRHPKDWPWSSWSFYGNGDRGLLTIDPVD